MAERFDPAMAELSGRSVQLRSIPGAAHSVWSSHFDEFIAGDSIRVL